jgi:hypothetical protein
MHATFRQPRVGRALAATLAVAALALAASCDDDDDDDLTGPSTTRQYNQIQRLGNPLVSEVLLAKRDHPHHGAIGPDGDVAAFGASVRGFVAAFRPQATTLQTTIAGALLPDMLVVQTDKAASTAGWLSWALADGYGGRTLNDDAVDIALSAVFSSLLSPTQSVCAPFTLPLCTDNVPNHNTAATTTFPYLAPPK